LSDIKAGLASLRGVIQGRQVDFIAIPPLGCGNGGLERSDVRPLIVEALGELPGVSVMVVLCQRISAGWWSCSRVHDLKPEGGLPLLILRVVGLPFF
jgi:hypothetical protein